MPSSPTNLRYLIAENIWLHRTLSDLSCTELGAVIGESGAQVMRYENGADEIAAAKLYAFAEVFGIPIGAFFTDNAAPAGAMVNLSISERAL
jgi:transcriptional regulator with XRE-family HTH domain